jgi:5-formyltetrahydrofolate cyclo-ligase
MLKSAIRTDYHQMRLNLAESEFNQLSAGIVGYFSTLVIPPPDIFLSYYPLVNRREFNVALCDKLVFAKNPMAKIAWPKTDSSGSRMEAHVLEEHGLFAKNKYNILEPIGDHSIPPESIDLVFVPLLAFDKNGYRVGYGKGFYDRYLARCRDTVIKIGFSFFDPVDVIDDIDEFDVPLSYCVTPSSLYEF